MAGSDNPSLDNAIEALIAFIAPQIAPLIERINVDEFTTVEFIDVMQLDPDAKRVYDEAVERWPERDPELAKLVIHGQVIPQLLRRSGLVEWAGFAYGERDPYGVPAWWKKTSSTTT
jgi:hypothetical protein